MRLRRVLHTRADLVEMLPAEAISRQADRRNMGYITQIVRGSYFDGPGLRTVVFLKGCPLRCAWCHNPETQDERIELLYDERRCIDCGRCMEACPQGLIDKANPARIDRSRCTYDELCTKVCPTLALRPSGCEMSVAEVLKEIEKDRAFYRHSQGGVTFSGGEPLFQLQFISELLSACRRALIHTVIDTCLAVEWSSIERVIPGTDLFLVDLKHSSHPSVKPDLVFANVTRLASQNVRIWIRVPVIPGWNDTAEEMERLAAFAKTLGGSVESVQLLPFHATADFKYRLLGRTWSFEGAGEIPAERMEAFRAIFESHGLFYRETETPVLQNERNQALC